MTETPFETGTPMRTVAPGIHVGTTIGHTLSIDTGDSLVQIDTGIFPKQAQGLIDELREISDLPISHIVYSHGHLGYNDACKTWLAHSERRGDDAPAIVAHSNLPVRYDRYLRTSALQQRINEIQFRLPGGALAGRPLELTHPDEVFDDVYVIEGRDRTVELRWAPSETDDAIAAWLPDERILFGGAATIDSIPNIGTPMRTVRDTLRWAETLDVMADLEPVLLIREHGDEVVGAPLVDDVLRSTAALLRHIHDRTLDLLNDGLLPDDIARVLRVPDDLDRPWLKPTYGHVEYIVRDVCRMQMGWWTDWNPTSLHPAPSREAAQAIAGAIADPEALLAAARRHRDAGRIDLALTVVDLLALADDGFPDARSLKAELCELAATETTSYVSRSMYAWTADRLRAASDPRVPPSADSFSHGQPTDPHRRPPKDVS